MNVKITKALKKEFLRQKYEMGQIPKLFKNFITNYFKYHVSKEIATNFKNTEINLSNIAETMLVENVFYQTNRILWISCLIFFCSN